MQNIEVAFCYSENQKFIRQSDFNSIQGWLEVHLFIATRSQERLRELIANADVVSRSSDPNELDLETGIALLDGLPFDKGDYKRFEPILLLYSAVQIAAVCKDIPLGDELLFGIEVTNLNPFKAKWRRGH